MRTVADCKLCEGDLHSDWDDNTLALICQNCDQRFGQHMGHHPHPHSNSGKCDAFTYQTYIFPKRPTAEEMYEALSNGT